MRQRFRSTRSTAPLPRRGATPVGHPAARPATGPGKHIEELIARLYTIADRVDGASLPRLAADLRAVCTELNALHEVLESDG
jgi:hypothetical protein